MNDHEIIEQLFQRSEIGLREISLKYSNLYKEVIRKVLSNECDVEEISNDILMALWESIPPKSPNNLPAYICRIAKNISVDRLRYNTRQKRGDAYCQTLSELDESIPCKDSENIPLNDDTIKNAINSFIRNLDAETQILFVRRYIYLESVASLAVRFNKSENHVSVKLHRARKKLKKLLESDGVKI